MKHWRWHTTEERQKMAEEYAACGSYSEVARRWGVALNTVKRAVTMHCGGAGFAGSRCLAGEDTPVDGRMGEESARDGREKDDAGNVSRDCDPSPQADGGMPGMTGGGADGNVARACMKDHALTRLPCGRGSLDRLGMTEEAESESGEWGVENGSIVYEDNIPQQIRDDKIEDDRGDAGEADAEMPVGQYLATKRAEARRIIDKYMAALLSDEKIKGANVSQITAALGKIADIFAQDADGGSVTIVDKL